MRSLRWFSNTKSPACFNCHGRRITLDSQAKSILIRNDQSETFGSCLMQDMAAVVILDNDIQTASGYKCYKCTYKCALQRHWSPRANSESKLQILSSSLFLFVSNAHGILSVSETFLGIFFVEKWVSNEYHKYCLEELIRVLF